MRKLLIALFILSGSSVFAQTPALTPFGLVWDQRGSNQIVTATLQIDGVQAQPVPFSSVITTTACNLDANCRVAVFRHPGLPAGNHSFEVIVATSTASFGSTNLVHSFTAPQPPPVDVTPINLRIVTQGQIIVNPDGSVTIIISP